VSFPRQCIDDRSAVLVVSAAGADDAIVEWLSGAEEYEVRAVEDGAAALAAVGADVWCVVARPSLQTDDGEDLVAVLRERHPETPVLVAVDAESDLASVARRIATAGGRIVPTTGADDADRQALQEAVRTALGEGEHRHADAWVRSIFDQFFEHYDVMGFVKDAEGRYVFASDYSGGPRPEALLGRTGLDLAREREAPLDVMERRHELAMSVLETNEPILEDVQRYGEGESAFWFSHTLVPWRDEAGEPRGVIGLVREVSERKRHERSLERQVARLEQFTSFVSHDLRSPLQLLQGYLDLARAGDEAAFDEIEYATERMEELLEDLEALATEEEPSIDRDRSAALVTTARDVWSVLSTPEATLEVDLPEATVVSASTAGLRPLLENLFKNVRDHAGEDVTVRLGALDGGFYVEDDGVGIPETERDDVFAEGYTTAEDGTGTGLSIVTDVAGEHGWDVDVTDGPDGGARFEFRNVMMATRPDVDYALGPPHEIEDSVDVGGIKTAGSAVREAPGTWTVRGAGDDIWKDANDFHFAYATLSGPARIEARVADVEAVNPFSKAGVIVRGGREDDATHAYVGRTVDRGPEVAWRSEAGAQTVTQQLRAPSDRAAWVRLERDGDRVTCSLSTDGERWDVVDQRDVALPERITVGLAVCSVVPRALCTARFENVAINEIQRVE